jgi:hypothetical protein
MVGASSLQEVNYCSTIGSNDQPADPLFLLNPGIPKYCSVNPIMLPVSLCCGFLVPLVSFPHWFRFDPLILEGFVCIP